MLACSRCSHTGRPGSARLNLRGLSPLQEANKAAIEAEASLLAFDRQNHMGASDSLAVRLRETISEEAEALLAEKRVAAGAVNIAENKDRMKVGGICWAHVMLLFLGWLSVGNFPWVEISR